MRRTSRTRVESSGSGSPVTDLRYPSPADRDIEGGGACGRNAAGHGAVLTGDRSVSDRLAAAAATAQPASPHQAGELPVAQLLERLAPMPYAHAAVPTASLSRARRINAGSRGSCP